MMNRPVRWLAAFAAALLPAAAGATPFVSLTDFAGACGGVMVCAGDAAEQGTALRLVPAAREQSGAAYLVTPVPLAGLGFVSTFTFRLTADIAAMRADGLAFLLVLDPSGLGTPDRYGGSMGYEGVANSLAVEFDIFDNGNEPGGSNHVAVNRDGTITNTVSANPYGQSACDGDAAAPGCMANGDIWTAIIGYNSVDHALSVAVRDGDGTTDLLIDRYGIDLPDVLGGNLAYAGFGAGTGDGRMDHDLLSWTMAPANPNLRQGDPDSWLAAALTAQTPTQVPEPGAATMLAMGMIALAGLASWRG
jgi:hypothetical protein